MLGVSTSVLAGLLCVVALAAIAVAGWYYYQFENSLEDVVDQRFADEDMVEFEPVRVTSTPMDYFRVMRHLQLEKKAAKKGYVKWYRLGANLQRPTWVQPEQTGEGMLRYDVDGQPYYFNKDAMTTDARTGAWVAMHRVGEADPINLDDPAYPGIEVDLLEKLINLLAESKPPGIFDNVLGGMDPTTMMYVGIAVLFVVYAAFRYMNGGL